MRRRRQAPKNLKGFTLIELVLVITIMGIISVVVARILFQGAQDFITAANISNAEWNGLLAVNRMANDVHTIRSAADISTISATQLVFNDINGNSVTYQLSGSNLLRNSQTLASGVSGFVLNYADNSGNATATPALVRYITIAITTNFGGVPASFTTTSATRGLA